MMIPNFIHRLQKNSEFWLFAAEKNFKFRPSVKYGEFRRLGTVKFHRQKKMSNFVRVS